jgi:hypothetical protein
MVGLGVGFGVGFDVGPGVGAGVTEISVIAGDGEGKVMGSRLNKLFWWAITALAMGIINKTIAAPIAIISWVLGFRKILRFIAMMYLV